MDTLEVFSIAGLIQDTIIEMALTNDRIFYNISDNSSFASVMSVGLLMNKPLKGSCGGVNCKCTREQ